MELNSSIEIKGKIRIHSAKSKESDDCPNDLMCYYTELSDSTIYKKSNYNPSTYKPGDPVPEEF